MVVSPAKRKWKGSERGTDPGGVVAASAEIEGGRGARGSQKGVKGDERGLPRAPRGRGSFIPGSRLATSSRISPSLAARQRAIYHRLRPNLLRHVSVPLSLYPSLPSQRTPYFTYLVPLLLLLLQPPSILISFSFVAPSRGLLPDSPLVNPRRELECVCFFCAGIESDSSVTLIPGIVDFSS